MKNKIFNIFGGVTILGGMLFSSFSNFSEMSPKFDETIVITDEESFKPISQSTVAISDDDGTSSFNGEGASNPDSGGHHWDKGDDNGKFIFTLPKVYSSIEINGHISVHGRYDEYYSMIGLFVPLQANVLTNSAETFRVIGTVNQGETVEIGSGEVTTILDTWGGDNYGYMNVTWYMSLDGVNLTIWTPSQTSYDWGEGEPTWLIDQIVPYSALEVPVEYHQKIGNGAPYTHYYDNAYPKYEENPELTLYGTL